MAMHFYAQGPIGMSAGFARYVDRVQDRFFRRFSKYPPGLRIKETGFGKCLLVDRAEMNAQKLKRKTRFDLRAFDPSI